MNAKPISEKSNPTMMQKAGNALFGSVFLIAGVCMLVFGNLMPWLSARAARDWPEVPCAVISSEVRRHDGDGSVSYSVEIEYRYDFDNQTFESSRYDFKVVNKSRKRCRQIVAGLPAGKKTVCFVDPDDPGSAVMDRNWEMGWLIFLMGCIFSAIGAAVAIGGILSGKRQRRSRDVSHTVGNLRGEGSVAAPAVVETDSCFPGDAEDQTWDVPQRLKPTSSPFKNFVGLCVSSAFWNGIVSIFVWNLFAGGVPDVFSVFMGLFLTPFILVGIVLLAATLQAFLTLLSPVVEIATTSGAVARGGTVDVAWEIIGNSNRISRLQISAWGTEEAKYRQGTDTVIDHSDFDHVIVVDTQDDQMIGFGSSAITIPAATMHTFEGENNKVTWALHVKATLRRWPDINQNYRFRVRP